MNDSATANALYDQETGVSPAPISPALQSIDEVFSAVGESCQEIEETFPMADLVERLRARFDWSWDVIDVLTDEQLQLLAFSVYEDHK